MILENLNKELQDIYQECIDEAKEKQCEFTVNLTGGKKAYYHAIIQPVCDESGSL